MATLSPAMPVHIKNTFMLYYEAADLKPGICNVHRILNMHTVIQLISYYGNRDESYERKVLKQS
jgi:hypothetical protein